MSVSEETVDAYNHINERFILHMRKLLEEEFGKDNLPWIIPMMSTESYIRSGAAGMTLGYIEAVKDSLEVTTASGVWCVVSYDYYAYIASVHPTKTAAVATMNQTPNRALDVGFLPFGEGSAYFGLEHYKTNLEVL